MIRRTRLKKAAVSLIFLIAAITIGTYVQAKTPEAAVYDTADQVSIGGNYKTNGTVSSVPVSGDIEAIDIGQPLPSDGSSCPDSQLYFNNFDDIIDVCLGTTIYDTIIVSGKDLQSIINLEKTSGPGDFESTPSIPPAYGYYEYTPISAGSSDVTFMAYNDAGDTLFATRTYVVYENQPPVIITGDTSLYNCYDNDFFDIYVEADDPDNDQVTYRVLSDNGYIDSVTGWFRFWTDLMGENCHTFEASDGCSADTAVICINAQWNTFPSFNNPDRKFVICQPDTICFDIDAFDPDLEYDSLIISQTAGPGTFTMTSDTGGVTCFLPDAVDSADYVFIYEATDKCLRGELPKDMACPPIPYDTVVVTVVYGEPPSIECPDDSDVFICEPDTICIPIGELPGGNVTIFPQSVWYDADNQSICFYTNCSVKKDITVVIETGCGLTSCEFSVNVTLNSPPLVMAPPDTSIFICEPQEICIPVGVTDMDGNIENTFITRDGFYNPDLGRVCFTPTVSGTYPIVVHAVDSCGAEDTDSVNVAVIINAKPVVSLPADTAVDLCRPEQICLDVEIFDVNFNLFNVTVSPTGFYDAGNEQICFTPDSDGVYNLTVSAVDECGAKGADTINVDVSLGSSPVVVSSPDTSIFMCELSDYCFPVSVTDPDNDNQSISLTGDGTYSNGYVCFTPQASGEFTFIIEASDSCGNTASDTTVITIVLNTPPQVVTADDFEVFQCDFEEICFDVDIIDPDNNIFIVSTNQAAVYDSVNKQICFTPDSPGVYEIAVTVTDSCYTSDVDTTVITVTTGDAAFIDCPEEPISRSICGQEEICEPLTIAPLDAVVTVPDGVTYHDGEICFTPDTTGTYIIDVIATADCGSDTCQVVFDISIGEIPQLTCPADTSVELCGADQICRPVGLLPQNAVVTVSPVGVYDNGEVCFEVDTSGFYEIFVKAETDCGLDSCHFGVDVIFNSAPQIVSGDTAFFSCEASEVFNYKVKAIDNEGDPITFALLSSFGTIDPNTGEISFTADLSSGIYWFSIEAADGCGADTALIGIGVELNSPPIIISATNDTIFMCEPTEFCFPVEISDLEHNITDITLIGEGSYDNGYVCFTPTGAGDYTFIIEATDECGVMSADTTVIAIMFNSAPLVSSADDFGVLLCGLEEICFDVNITDYDNNLFIISTNESTVYDSITGKVCYTPDGPGIDTIIVTATDSCYATGVDTTVIDVVVGEIAEINCPSEPFDYNLCGLQEICIPLDITPDDPTVAVSEGAYYSNGELCITPDTSGTYIIKVIATADCGADSCDIIFNVQLNQPAEITCPDEPIYESICPGETVCYPLTITPDNAVITIPDYATYTDGDLCFMPDTAGTYNMEIIAAAECGADTCQLAFVVDLGEPARIECPVDQIVESICNPDTICYNLPIYPVDAHVTVPEGTYYDGQNLCFMADTTGVYNFEVIASTECGADTCNLQFSVEIGEAPQVICPPDTALKLCSPETICRPVVITPSDAIVTVSPMGMYAGGMVCFDAETSGSYVINVEAENECGKVDCSFTVDVVINVPPEIISADTEYFICDPGMTIEYMIHAADSDDAPLTFGLNSEFGQINSETGLLSFVADTAGSYCFEAVALDSCSADTAMICITVDLNSPPVVVSGPDSTITVCAWDREICVPVDVSDIDENINSIETSPGSYSNGFVCFTPTGPGEYNVVTTLTDECGALDSDTTVVTVIAGQAINLDCPVDTSVFICGPDTLCFPINGIPDDAKISIFPPSAWYDADDGTICFYTNCEVEKNLKIVAANDCGIDSCEFTVSVTMNSRPLVLLPPSKTMTLCGEGEICIPVGIADADDNLVDIAFWPEGAVYNPISGRICFTPTAAGEYVVKVTATDACGSTDSDSTIITVIMNSAPTITSAEDFAVYLCEPTEICFAVDINDVDKNLQAVTVSPDGDYNAETGEVCFTPQSSGLYNIEISATDSCGKTASAATTVMVTLNSPPTVNIEPYTSVVVCNYDPLCLPLIVNDVDNNLDSIIVTGANLVNEFVCLEDVTPGIHEIIISAYDSCRAVTIDTAIVEVILNSPPVVRAANDFDIFQCQFEEICFDATVSDPDNNIIIVSTDLGTYDSETGQVCFTPDDTGTYRIIITAVDDCQRSASDTIFIRVTSNEAADIDCPLDPIDFSYCGTTTICYPISFTPDDAVISTIPEGVYEDGQLCFEADTSGTYSIEVTAESECGTDMCTFEFAVNIGQAAQVICPSDTSIFLCGPETICLPVSIMPDYAEVTVLPFGQYSAGEICFMADTAGHYAFDLLAETDCGDDSCRFDVDVIFNTPPVVDAGNDTAYFQCDFEEICRSVSIIDTDNDIDSVVVAPVGYYNSNLGFVCFTPEDTGTYCLTVTAYDECKDSGSDEVCIIVTTGPAAEIERPTEPFNVSLCVPEEICIPLVIAPASAEVSPSFGNYSDGQLCFTADTAGTYIIDVVASEICGADTCQVTVNVTFNEYVEIICPDLAINKVLCGPSNISVLLPISPISATVTVTPIGQYSFADSLLTFMADTSGHYEITVIAQSPCNADTCTVRANVAILNPPQITCPGDIDTLLCFTDSTDICFEVELTGDSIDVVVRPAGSYDDGMVCVPITDEGTQTVTVVASSVCGVDSCSLDITVTRNQTPELTIPEDIMAPWCSNDTGQICIDGIFAVDPDGNPLTITKTCGPGTYTPIRDDSGVVCFTPDNIDTTYEFCLEAYDGCSTDSKSLFVTVFPSAICSVCVNVSIETDSCVVVGSRVPVRVKVQTNDLIAGFDLLIGYDNSGMSFLNVNKGPAIPDWEYFTYRLSTEGNCGSNCPSGLIRLVGIADQNDGPHHPPQDQLTPEGVVANITMIVSNDQTIGGQYLPISFYWLDCGDNSFADPTGELQYVEARIYNYSGHIIWEESDDIHYPEESRPIGFGTPDSCMIGDKVSPVRCIYFYNGGICVKHPEDIDARGDLNLNGVPYEIADAVIYTNFFIYGMAAFTINPDGQMAASDVNADGYALTVADLVYLIRIIVGDALAIPRLSPNFARMELSVESNNGGISINAESYCNVGAGVLVFEYDGINPAIPQLGEMAEGMDYIYSINDSEIRVLIYSLEYGRAIGIGDGNLLNINCNGSGDIRLKEFSFATFHGDMMQTKIKSALVPDRFEVSQNYPNPFNPMTSIDLSLPAACTWTMTIYNINGQAIRKISRHDEAGVVTIEWDGTNDFGQSVASGVYLYRVEAGNHAVSKKMILLK